MGFISELQQTFKKHSNLDHKLPMESYMKHKFEFFGIKSAHRKQLLKEVVNKHKSEVIENIRTIVIELYNLPQREFHYSAMEIMDKFLKKTYLLEDIELIKHLLINHSHWDTVDFIAKHILGNYLLNHPNKTEDIITNFSNSDNMWLNRSAILFQLGRKEQTIPEYLFMECKKHSKSKEFFIQKAIGWALRDYAKTNPKAVKQFVETNNLAPLSTREALKHFK